jgi:hypothetical protein
MEKTVAKVKGKGPRPEPVDGGHPHESCRPKRNKRAERVPVTLQPVSHKETRASRPVGAASPASENCEGLTHPRPSRHLTSRLS